MYRCFGMVTKVVNVILADCWNAKRVYGNIYITEIQSNECLSCLLEPYDITFTLQLYNDYCS